MEARPTVDELLDAVRGFRERESFGAPTPRDLYLMRVAESVLAIVEREKVLGPAADDAEAKRLAAILGPKATDKDLAKLIRDGAFDEGTQRRALIDHLKASVADRIAIDNPKWVRRTEQEGSSEAI